MLRSIRPTRARPPSDASVDPTDARNTVEVEQAEADAREDAISQQQPPAVACLGPLGDDRILREVGRGGMGVVYEAEPISPGRAVAPKVLPGQVSGNRVVPERSCLEARAAAGLHHTDMVPVFEMGRDGEAAYSAMPFIRGLGLDQVIVEVRRFRHPDRKSLGLGPDGPGGGRRRPALAATGAPSPPNRAGPSSSPDGRTAPDRPARDRRAGGATGRHRPVPAGPELAMTLQEPRRGGEALARRTVAHTSFDRYAPELEQANPFCERMITSARKIRTSDGLCGLRSMPSEGVRRPAAGPRRDAGDGG